MRAKYKLVFFSNDMYEWDTGAEFTENELNLIRLAVRSLGVNGSSPSVRAKASQLAERIKRGME